MKRPRLLLLQPLRQRDFALLSFGSTVSLLGDGVLSVALVFQVYQLDNSPSAYSAVAFASALPMIGLLLFGGVLSDRLDRRRVLIAADLLRAIVLCATGLLGVSGALRLWHLLVLMPFMGVGAALFNPASSALLPDLLPTDDLPRANAFRGSVTPLMLQLIGPALGGALVGVAGAGWAILLDAATFLLSAAAVWRIRARPARGVGGQGSGTVLREIREGFGFVRANPWCWATLAGASLSLLVWNGPVRVLLPYVVKNRFHTGAQGLGFVFAAGGAGAILASLLIGQVGLSRRHITAMYLAWGIAIAGMAGYGVATRLWQAVAIAFAVNAILALGEITWVTLLQTLVPNELLGRVSSLDWLISTGLVPLSLAITGPVAALAGVRTTLTAGPLLGGVIMLLFLFVPGVRRPEQQPRATTVSASLAKRT